MLQMTMFKAAKIGNLEYLKRIEINESSVDRFGANCLHYAARGGSLEVVKFLINVRGFSVLARTRTGSSALQDAAATGNTAIIKWLIENTELKDANDQDGAGISSLHLAAKFGHALTVEWLLDEASADANSRSTAGALPLHFAADGGNLNCVKILVDESPRSVNMQMNNGVTPLYIACQSGHLNLAMYLVTRNANSKIAAYDAMTCLHAATQNGHLAVVIWLIKEERCNPNERDFDGNTALHYAASRGHEDIVYWLMKEGGARITLDNLGGSPLHNAAELGELGSIKALLESGCDQTLTDNEGLIAAELADRCQQTEAASLIRQSLDIDEGVPLIRQSLAIDLINTSGPATVPQTHTGRGLHSSEAVVINSCSKHPYLSEERYSPSPPLPPPPPPLPPEVDVDQDYPLPQPPSPPPPLFEEEEGENISQLKSRTHSSGLINRSLSQISVDSSASNFGVFQNRNSETHTVTAEIHKIPANVPSTPRPSTSSLVFPTQRQNPASAPDLPTPPQSPQDSLLSESSTVYSELAPSERDLRLSWQPQHITNRLSLFQNKVEENESKSPNNDRLSDLKSVSHKSAFAKAKALFESGHPESSINKPYLGINEENGEYIYPARTSVPSTMTDSNSSVDISTENGSRGTIISIHGNTSTIVNSDTNGSHTAGTELNHSNMENNITSVKNLNISTPTVDTGESKKGSNSVASTNNVLNGHTGTRQNAVESKLSISRNSSSSSLGSQPLSPQETKNNLIADIASAVSGSSNLSLRRAKSRGEGVSMVYQSSKRNSSSNQNSVTKVESNTLTGQFDPKNFLDQVEKTDSSGRVIPEWRRQVLAKHAAEKAQKDFEEKKQTEDYESRFKDMPAWKRALIERKEAQAREEENKKIGS